ncbi:DUF7848 domain-containing protein [Streptomyces sp. NPDC003032]
MGATRTFRFRSFTLRPDTASDSVLTHMECKTFGCEQGSAASERAEDGSAWAADHLKVNPEHTGYREVITRDYAFQPGEWL